MVLCISCRLVSCTKGMETPTNTMASLERAQAQSACPSPMRVSTTRLGTAPLDSSIVESGCLGRAKRTLFAMFRMRSTSRRSPLRVLRDSCVQRPLRSLTPAAHLVLRGTRAMLALRQMSVYLHREVPTATCALPAMSVSKALRLPVVSNCSAHRTISARPGPHCRSLATWQTMPSTEISIRALQILLLQFCNAAYSYRVSGCRGAYQLTISDASMGSMRRLSNRLSFDYSMGRKKEGWMATRRLTLDL